MEDKYFMIDIKIKRYAWNHHGKYDNALTLRYRSEDDYEIENMHCDEKIKKELQNILEKIFDKKIKLIKD